MAGLKFLISEIIGHGIKARTHAHAEITHFPTQCIISTWKAFGLQPRAFQAPMIHPIQKCAISAWVWIFAIMALVVLQILVMTEPEGEHIIRSGKQHGLIGTFFTAYNEHRHLILRPDDLWLAITTAFNLYVNNHAEEMRSHFVTFEGKKDLVVCVGGAMGAANWNYVLGLMADEVEKNTNR